MIVMVMIVRRDDSDGDGDSDSVHKVEQCTYSVACAI